VKRARHNRIISNKFYTPEELAETVGLCKHSVLRHIKSDLPADTGVKPFLIYGRDAKEYFTEKYSRDRDSQANEVKCHGCKARFTFYNVPVRIYTTGLRYSQDKIQVVVSGACPECSREFWRFKSLETRSEIDRGAEIPIDVFTSGGER